MLIRLQKIIADAGITSRRSAEELIVGGKVCVNGAVVTKLGSKADPLIDVISVNDRKIRHEQKKIYLMMYKPTRYVTTMNDPEGRDKVTDLLKGVRQRVYPVGRLDYDTSGLLLFTNDGAVANKLAHPRGEVQKTYRAKIEGRLTADELIELKKANNALKFRAPKSVFVEKATGNNSWIVITISEGKNRQIRRMCEAVNHHVLKLVRTAYGQLTLQGLKIGEYRYLTPKEESYIKNI